MLYPPYKQAHLSHIVTQNPKHNNQSDRTSGSLIQKHYRKCYAVRHNTKTPFTVNLNTFKAQFFQLHNPVYDRQNTQVPQTRLVITQKETTIVIYRKIPTVSTTSQTRTGKINTTNLIAINVQLYQKLRRFIHKYSSRHGAQACTMTSQYPVKIHVVASFSIFPTKSLCPHPMAN